MGYHLVARGVHTDTTTDLEEENLPLVLPVMTFPRLNNAEFTPGTSSHVTIPPGVPRVKEGCARPVRVQSRPRLCREPCELGC